MKRRDRSLQNKTTKDEKNYTSSEIRYSRMGRFYFLTCVLRREIFVILSKIFVRLFKINVDTCNVPLCNCLLLIFKMFLSVLFPFSQFKYNSFTK